ncbi:MAG TPA: outer membrane lipoprotein-sorting protein [Chitinophagales bacterium]|nr:outer membrane lipoprotein-sorting protein [Chitinophagales bacterium]
MTKFILMLLVLAAPAFEQQPDPVQIVKNSEAHMRGKTLKGEMTIKIIRPEYTREMSMKMWMKGTDFSLIQVTEPAKDKGTTFLKRKKEVWDWVPTLERTIKLPPSMMSQSWMGTDFTNDDLVKESSVVDDYTQSILGEEKIGDRPCYKIQLIPKPTAAVVWSKVLLWIDKKDYLQLKTEMYDEDGQLVNTMLGSDVKMLGGRLLPTTLEMTPADKPGHKTIIIYKQEEFDQPISDDFFSTQNMKNPR